MADGPTEQVTTALRCSDALVVAVWADRLELPVLGAHVVDRAGLALLAAYAEGEHRAISHAARLVTGDPEDGPFVELSRRLVRRGGLVRRPLGAPARDRPAAPSVRLDRTGGERGHRLRTPIAVHPVASGFEVVGHRGEQLVVLGIDELLHLGGLAEPRPLGEQAAWLAERAGVGRDRADEVVQALARHHLLAPAHPSDRLGRSPDGERQAVREAFGAAARAQEDAEERRRRETGRRRTRVVPVSFTLGPPLALGLIASHLRHGEGGRLTERYDVRLDWVWDDELLDLHAIEPIVVLGSAYVWSHVAVLEVARAVKARQPRSIVVLGGPDVPKAPDRAAAYLAAHPEVDVLVRGEGEQTAFELLDALVATDDGFDLAPLAQVPGLTVRAGGRVVRTAERDRLADLGMVPSPFLTGLFDTYARAPLPQVILETNRGCPYGCTFCDWGSATASRIRSHDLGRVLAELRWCAEAAADVVSFADANFGIFARDVELATEIARLHRTHGHPRGFGANFAKNTVKHLAPIIRTLVDAGIVNRGLLALQTTDEATLDAVARSNIKVERYDAVAAEMRAAGLPFAVELMMGLPGQTPESFRRDLQQCIDREVEGTVNPTTVLVNSPMNEPAYLADHAIETAQPVGPGTHALVVSTTTFSREEYGAMRRLRRAFLLCQNFGVTRHVDRVLRQETGRPEIEILEQRLASVVDDVEARERYPHLRLLLDQPSDALVPPVSWADLVAELVDHARQAHPDASPTALEVAGAVQLAHLPAFDRLLPEEVWLRHDYAAWFAEVLAAKEAGHLDDWPERVPRLDDFGPGWLQVDDPGGRAASQLGCSVDHGPLLASWEHRSEVSRALFAATADA